MNLSNIILLAGRPGSGKTEMLIAYANLYPKTTLFISNESTQETLINRGLSKEITYYNNFENVDLSTYKILCIDYLELFDQELIQKVITNALEQKLRIIVATQMKRNGEINNIFGQI